MTIPIVTLLPPDISHILSYIRLLKYTHHTELKTASPYNFNFLGCSPIILSVLCLKDVGIFTHTHTQKNVLIKTDNR
jgi:hypothetical protein